MNKLDRIKANVANYESTFKWHQHPDAVAFKDDVKVLLPVVEASMEFFKKYSPYSPWTDKFPRDEYEKVLWAIQELIQQDGVA